ncbi:MAG TPA: hypothetical protein VFS87_04060 [Qipengyuania sp.]|nr:hypothetical protein [Qipengyuania sp.]
MREPSLRTSRLAIAGAIAALAISGGAGFYLGRSSSPDASEKVAANPVPPATQQPIMPVIEPLAPLDRAGLIDLADAAADAVASGTAPPARVQEAADRRFEIAIPFGCAGPAEADSEARLRWRYEEGEETLRLHVAVTRWTAAQWGLQEPAGGEAIEGFWIERPWSSSGECLTRSVNGPTPAVVSGVAADQTLAIAQFFAEDVRREALRGDRPFQSVQRIASADFAAPRGFRLMLSGRIERIPGGETPVHCIQPGGPGQRPRCIVAVTLDEVRIENPASGEVLATWPIGGD